MYDQYNVDLADYIGYSNANDGYRYLLFVIDVFSRYLWVEPIKNKADRSIVEAFRDIFARGRKPRCLRTDRGKEFRGNILEDYFKSINVKHFVLYNQEIKANYAERVIMTLKKTIRSYMQLRKTYHFIDVLRDIVHSYNNTEHRTIDMAPADVKLGDIERRLWQHLYKPKEVYYKWRAWKVGKLKYK